MIDGVFVINPTVHAYNLRDDNLQPGPVGTAFRDYLWLLHTSWNPPDIQVPKDVYLSDWPIEVLAETLFLETDVDLAGNQNLRLDSWFHDGLCSRAKNVEAIRRWPDRFVAYLGVDPTQSVEACIRDLREQAEELPGAVGLKLYPDQVNPLRSWRMDDPTIAYPLFEAAAELGIRTVAVHKAVPNGPVPLNPYRVDDVDGAAIHFPELNFEIVHSGLAFVEETAQAISRFPNVYANLELTSALLYRAPRAFEELMATFMYWAGPHKIIWSDGTLFCHSQALLEGFMNFTFPERLIDGYRMEQITRSDKEKILGGNYARVAGIDIEQAKIAIANDEFTERRRVEGRAAPYSNWLSAAATDRAAP
jgi:predicted TIM-barrel fold metal-dependent hydrolase